MPIVVRVTDAADGSSICDASVAATSAEATYHLQMVPTDEQACAYELFVAVAGTYQVSTTAPGFNTARQDDVVVTVDECGNVQNTNDLTVTLSPTSADGGQADQ